MKKVYASLALAAALCCFSNVASAGKMTVFQSNGWQQVAAEDLTGTFDQVTPGYGGQAFDAEYLFYKIDGNILYLGLQAGFNLKSGTIYSNAKNYYAGDLALSFDNDSRMYEYAVDFGLYTENFYNKKIEADKDGDGVDAAGVYDITEWDQGVYSGYTASNPFAMAGGTLKTSLITNDSIKELVGKEYSYYRIVSFDLTPILGSNWAASGFTLGAHWTMSCGNDAINGTVNIPGAPVPEPTTMLLFGAGLAGLAAVGRRRRSN